MAAALVTIAPGAVAEVVSIAAWWEHHRPLAPRLFLEELDGALVLLVNHPESGRRVRAKGRPNLRAMALRRSGYLLFYYNEQACRLIVVRVRHGRRRPLRRHQR